MSTPVRAICTFLVLLSSGAVSAASFITLPNGFNLYNTGDFSPATFLDNHYFMTLNPFSPGTTAVFVDSASYLSPATAESTWIGPSGENVHAPESVYRVAIDIDLTGVDAAALNLNGYWVSDNKGLDILVNGNSTGQTNNGFHSQQPSASPDNAFTITGPDGLIAGLNTIEFEWGNGPAGGANSQFPNPTHVRVEFTEYSFVPVPAAAWLFASGLIGLAGLARRKASL